jgi:TonB dependent receptor.
MHGPGLRRREPRADARDQEGRANTFHDLELRWNAPWEATVAIGANNVLDHVGPVLYSQPSANVPYSGQFDIGRFVYMKY